MNTKSLAVIAILLWGVTAAFVGFKFVKGSTMTAEDGREAVVLDAGERAFILTEMRGMLAAVQDILSAANAGDMAAVKDIAYQVGMAEVAGVPVQTMLKLPIEFKQLGKATHVGFDDIGKAADNGAKAVLEKLDENMSRCVACHEGYQFTVAE